MIDLNYLLFALLAAAGWGTYLVPIKKGRLDNSYSVQAGIGIGAFFFAISSLLFYSSLSINLYGVIAGIIWSVANLSMLKAIRMLELSRAVPLTGSLVIIISFLWGLLYFNESVSSLLYTIVGIIMLVIAIQMIGFIDISRVKPYIFIIISGILWGSLYVPLKFSQFDDSYFSMSLTIFLASIPFLKRNIKSISYGSISGIIWNSSNLASFIAIEALGLTIGYPLTQISIIIAALWGLLYFKETKSGRERTKIYLSTIIIIIGSIFLALGS